MKILLTAPCLGAFGGIEAFCLRLARHLIEEEGFEVKLAQSLDFTRGVGQALP